MWIIIFEADTADVYDMLGYQSEPEAETGSETGSEPEAETGSETGSEPEAETGSETGSEPEAETGSDTGSNMRDYFVVCPSDKLRSIPHGIFEQTAWHALTIKLDGLEITPHQIKNVSDCYGMTATRLYPEWISVDYDTHWDCYCKTKDVCGCGCDPLHDGW
jgi:hypothetical protein